MTKTDTDKLPGVCKWMRMTQDQVLDKFYGLNTAFSDGEGQKRFVYVPGTREDRVLLVAHADTVWGNVPLNLCFYDDIIFSLDRNNSYEVAGRTEGCTVTKRGRGIGADDRAGCAILWYLRDLGHSLLITSGEEKGCIGSRYLMNSPWWREEINQRHNFAVQFDRRGKKDLVFYDVGTKSFVKYVQEQTGYTPATGSYTDIRHLCTNICGVNISVGYYGEHTAEEKLVYNQWLNTLHTTFDWLSKPDIPKHRLEIADKYYGPTPSYASTNHGRYGDDYAYSGYEVSRLEEGEMSEYLQKKADGSRISGKTITSQNTSIHVVGDDSSATGQVVMGDNEEAIMMCPFCFHKMLDQEWYENQMSCTSCDKSF